MFCLRQSAISVRLLIPAVRVRKRDVNRVKRNKKSRFNPGEPDGREADESKAGPVDCAHVPFRARNEGMRVRLLAGGGSGRADG